MQKRNEVLSTTGDERGSWGDEKLRDIVVAREPHDKPFLKSTSK
jgi:hypothetical protein